MENVQIKGLKTTFVGYFVDLCTCVFQTMPLEMFENKK